MARQTTVRHRAPESEDTFVSGVLEATDWTRRHGRLLIGAIIALIVVIAGILYYRNYREALETRAANELGQIRQIAASGNVPLATSQLQQFVAKFGGTPAGGEGRLLLGQSMLEQGNSGGAITALKPLASDLSDPLGPSAAMLLGAAYESRNSLKDAEETYLQVADKAEFQFQKRDALESAARLKLQNGDPAGAAALYQRILAQMPDTAVGRSVYQMRLAEAQAQTGSTAGKK